MNKDTASKIISELSLYYDDKPALKFSSVYELLVAVILSAQCTDERVNKVTEKLFKVYNTPEKMTTLTVEELGEKIFSCGLYKTKAEHILSASKDITEKFGGQVPDDLDSLRSLAGVGRKTANVVYSVGFGKNAIAVDTHVFRVANRIGLATAKDVLNTEKQLMAILDENCWSKAHHYIIFHGRAVCKAGKPDCENCQIKNLCEKHLTKKR
ncbi:MAG: endonuclease III [Clostridia bacterium]|nr:endonuclease III [Clostridia bacterium]